MVPEFVLTFILGTVFVNGKLYEIPNNFSLGVAISSYQSEGAWNVNGKGENIWDHLTHTRRNYSYDGSNGDIACDSYHKWKEDVQQLKYLGVDHYRFSISWSRILPSGFSNVINPDGIRYYNDLINELLKNGIKPLVTIFHWDLPQPLQDLGGLANLKVTQYVEDYSRILFQHFGDRVKWWITFNEPLSYCLYGYNGVVAPAILSSGVGSYLCGKTLLLSHGKIFRLYEREFRKEQEGKVGITVNIAWFMPKTNSEKDKEAVARANDFLFGWWMHPIFSKEGNYPKRMSDRIEYVSKAENFSESRLPPFTKEEIKLIRGSYDFFGFNYYLAQVIQDDLVTPYNPPSFDQDVGVVATTIPGVEETEHNWFPIYPQGMGDVLRYIHKLYKGVPIIITENGYPDSGQLSDPRRINYIQRHLIEVLKAKEEGVNVFGYTYWSFMDDYEWLYGYLQKFGLFNVDFNDPNRTRTPKASAEFFRLLTKYRVVPSDTIDC
ncbi:myrosinase 1 [Agrilus planipennis]|uniref:Myrosinase 1 n=1 Tax=Agrilus planipennis TaxID=224129 RepID=A0A1W4WMX7_AGRPL|nr:myrosinase 1 [Agrilus planipennis]